jgi:hypothetical protein
MEAIERHHFVMDRLRTELEAKCADRDYWRDRCARAEEVIAAYRNDIREKADAMAEDYFMWWIND